MCYLLKMTQFYFVNLVWYKNNSEQRDIDFFFFFFCLIHDLINLHWALWGSRPLFWSRCDPQSRNSSWFLWQASGTKFSPEPWLYDAHHNMFATHRAQLRKHHLQRWQTGNTITSALPPRKHAETPCVFNPGLFVGHEGDRCHVRKPVSPSRSLSKHAALSLDRIPPRWLIRILNKASTPNGDASDQSVVKIGEMFHHSAVCWRSPFFRRLCSLFSFVSPNRVR